MMNLSWDIVVGTENKLWAAWSRVWILAVARNFSLLRNVQMSFGPHTTSWSGSTKVISRGYSNWGVMLTTHLHVVRTRMSGVIPLFH